MRNIFANLGHFGLVAVVAGGLGYGLYNSTGNAVIDFVEGLDYPNRQPAAVEVEIVGYGHGSGTHLGNGYILTAGHVVTNMDAKFRVVMADGTAVDAEPVIDNDKYDVALLHISEKAAALLASAPLATHNADRGTVVSVRGWTAPWKDVSSFGSIASSVQSWAKWPEIQVVNLAGGPGVSGAGVMNAAGEVVGIFNGGVAPHGALGAMVPSETIAKVLGVGIRTAP